MTRKQLPYFVVFLVLMFGAMACACLGSGTGIGGFQATANAAFTQAAAGAATAGAVSGGATQEATAASTEAGTGGNGTTAGGPKDVPIMSGDVTNVVTTGQLVSFQTKADVPTVVAFYKDAMPKNGWTLDASKSVESSAGTVLDFTKGTRSAVATIAKDPSSGQTIVGIVVQ